MRIPAPMLATSATKLPTGPDWTYEVKWDGYRAIAEKRGRAVRLHSRNQKDLTQNYPSVAHALQTLAVRDAVLDGEIVAIDEKGRPSFQALQHSTRSHAIVYYAFYILELKGASLTKEPIERRRRYWSRRSRDRRCCCPHHCLAPWMTSSAR
jgi:bifunctional non-homologous end joining protein LigD